MGDGRKELMIAFLPLRKLHSTSSPLLEALPCRLGTWNFALRSASLQPMTYSTGPHVPGHSVFAGLAVLITSLLPCQPIRQQLGVGWGGVSFQGSCFVLQRILVPSQRRLTERSRKGAGLSFLGLAAHPGKLGFGKGAACQPGRH